MFQIPHNLLGTAEPTAASETIGAYGSGATGLFVQTGGTNMLCSYNSITLGYAAACSGSYQLGGTGLLSAAYENIGNSGSGTFTQSDGTNAGNGTIPNADLQLRVFRIFRMFSSIVD